MTIIPKKPSRIEPVNFPAFAQCWFANPGTQLSLRAFCGGGGSARTGVNNAILLQRPDGKLDRIDTGEKVGVAIKIVQNPTNERLFLIVALDNCVQKYNLPTCEKSGEIDVGVLINAVAISSDTSKMAVGCDDGNIKVYGIGDELFEASALFYTCEGHENAVCSLDFSCLGNRLVSSAKDGTARVWENEQCIAVLKCDVEGGVLCPRPKKNKVAPKRPMQVLVRGCAFADMEGKYVLTVASAKRGSCFLGQWFQKPDGFQCERTEVNEVPCSAMSLSLDWGLMALGSVDGSVLIWDVLEWKLVKKFPEVHDLPVTCIAVRPVPIPLQNDEDGVQFHAVSASADSRLAYLSLQRPLKEPGKPGAWQKTFSNLYNLLVWFIVFFVLARPLWVDARERCGHALQASLLDALPCVRDEVFIAPSTRPGIASIPY